MGCVEDHTRRLRDRIGQLRAAGAQLDLTAADGGRQRRVAQEELQRVEGELAEAHRRLTDARQQAIRRPHDYSIIPYDGPNQTHRRPIYLECRADAVVLQPEGIAFHESDFAGSLGPDNPLAAALRAVREYLADRGAFDPRADGEPYPLLLVRPQGIMTYYAARAAMQWWAADFGYELIEDDWKLHFPAPDLQLAKVVDRAIVQPRAELAAAAVDHARRQAAFASYGGGDEDGFTSGDSGSTHGGAGGGRGGGGRGGYGTGAASGPGGYARRGAATGPGGGSPGGNGFGSGSGGGAPGTGGFGGSGGSGSGTMSGDSGGSIFGSGSGGGSPGNGGWAGLAAPAAAARVQCPAVRAEVSSAAEAAAEPRQRRPGRAWRHRRKRLGHHVRRFGRKYLRQRKRRRFTGQRRPGRVWRHGRQRFRHYVELGQRPRPRQRKRRRRSPAAAPLAASAELAQAAPQADRAAMASAWG